MRTAALIVAMSLVGACSSSPASDSTTTSPTAPLTTSAPTTTTTLEPIPVWVRATIEPTTPDNAYEAMNAVVAFSDQLVAAGTSERGAEIWLSSDGLRWSRIALQPDLTVSGGEINDLILAGPGLVAVGQMETEEGFGPAVWMSTDGLAWSRASPDPPTLDGPRHAGIGAVAAGPDRLVAVGYETRWGHAAIWSSVDGAEWSRVPDDADMFGDASTASYRSIDDIVAFEGGFLAVGTAQDGDNTRASVWLSADGVSWLRLDAIPGGAAPGYQAMRSVAVMNGMLVAVGQQNTGAAVWISGGGVEWTRIGGTSVRPPGSEMRAVLSTGDGLVAVGFVPESGLSDGAIWRSADGSSWSREESAALGGRWSQEILAGIEFAGGIALVGTGSTELGGITPAAWYIGPSTAVVPTTTTTQAPRPTIVTPPDAPEFQMRCGEIVRSYESPPPTTFPNCGWRVVTDPWWTLARWTLDPDNPPDPTESVLHVLATETACAGGAIPEGREIRSALMTSGDEVVAFVLIEPSQFPMNCPGNPSFPFTIDLERPLGELRLYEGFLVPPLERYPEP